MKHFVKYMMFEDSHKKRENPKYIKPCEKYHKKLKNCLTSNNNIEKKCNLQVLSLRMCLSKNNTSS
jgi:hypothetical protein